MTHADLVERARRWLKNTKRCAIVVHEFVSSCMEIPDAIGWCGGGRLSILVECKVSVEDFYRDKAKPFRRAGISAGAMRYYLTPRGLLKPEQIPPEWGLLEFDGNRVHVIVEASETKSRGHHHEIAILYSACRRLASHYPNHLDVVAVELKETPELEKQKCSYCYSFADQIYLVN